MQEFDNTELDIQFSLPKGLYRCLKSPWQGLLKDVL